MVVGYWNIGLSKGLSVAAQWRPSVLEFENLKAAIGSVRNNSIACETASAQNSHLICQMIASGCLGEQAARLKQSFCLLWII